MLPNVVKIYVENDNVVSTLPTVVQIKVEMDNADSTLFNVLNFNVDVHNVVSTLIWHCALSRYHINLKTTLKYLLGSILNGFDLFIMFHRLFIWISFNDNNALWWKNRPVEVTFKLSIWFCIALNIFNLHSFLILKCDYWNHDWAKSKHCLTIVQLNIFDTLQSRLRQISLWSFEESL